MVGHRAAFAYVVLKVELVYERHEAIIGEELRHEGFLSGRVVDAADKGKQGTKTVAEGSRPARGAASGEYVGEDRGGEAARHVRHVRDVQSLRQGGAPRTRA